MREMHPPLCVSTPTHVRVKTIPLYSHPPIPPLCINMKFPVNIAQNDILCNLFFQLTFKSCALYLRDLRKYEQKVVLVSCARFYVEKLLYLNNFRARQLAKVVHAKTNTLKSCRIGTYWYQRLSTTLTSGSWGSFGSSANKTSNPYNFCNSNKTYFGAMESPVNCYWEPLNEFFVTCSTLTMSGLAPSTNAYIICGTIF